MRPGRDAFSAGKASRMRRTALIRLSSKAISQSPSPAFSKGAVGGPPALVTRQSRPPNAAMASATTRFTSSGRETSAAEQPAAPISAAARLSSSTLREQTKTRAPSPAKALAQALPSPLLAPAMNALQPFKPRSMGEPFGGRGGHAKLSFLFLLLQAS